MAISDKQESRHLPIKRRKALPVLAFMAMAGAAGAAYVAAVSLADYAESRLVADVSQALQGDEFSWVSVRANGAEVHISGTAPDEVTRYRTLLRAENAVTLGHVIDDMQVAAVLDMPPPDFKVELLRNDLGISIIGLVPAGLDRAAVLSGLQRDTQTGQVSDLLETADYPVPADWDEAFSFGLRAAQLAERSKVSIQPGQVMVQAITDDQAAQEVLLQALRRNTPENVTLIADITAPRPVISPFALQFTRDDQGARFDRCSANDEEAQTLILAAGQAAGVTDQADCQLGLGKPSEDWGMVAVAAIEAVGELDQGMVTLLDTEVTLSAPAAIPADKFDAVAAKLADTLPAPFILAAKQDSDPDATPPETEFLARVIGTGQVVLEGVISDARMRDTVESFARSRFGQVESDLQLDPDLPSGWTLRTIAALEAMADLQRGTAWASPDLIRITGTSGDQDAAQLASTRLAERLGAGMGYEFQITYDRRLDPVLGLPSGPVCVDQLNTIMRESLIGFEPNRSVIAGDPKPTLELLAGVMTECGDFRIELGGHTDSQGSESFNAELSRKRAQALLNAMADHGISTGLMSAQGYGESQPIADNDTDAGREANRRIEFRLLSEDPVQPHPTGPVPVVKGVTQAADAASQPVLQDEDLVADDQGQTGGGLEASVEILPLQGMPAPQDVGDGPEGGLVQMIATILVTELALSPELAIDIADVPEEEPGPLASDLDAIIQAATAPVQLVFGSPAPDALTHAATGVGRAAVGTGSPVLILTPGDSTPRPRPRP